MESLGAQGTVIFLLNILILWLRSYQARQMVDKFIGDAIAAGFGIPVSNDDDEDRGVRAG